MTRIFYDSTTIDDIPADAVGIFAYANGRYANVGEARQKFPHAVIGTIAVSADAVADILDVERGDATPEQAPGWALRMRLQGRVAYVYCSASSWGAVKAAFAQSHVPEPEWGIADYDNVAQMIPGAIYKQYGGNLPGHYDLNIVADYLPGIDQRQNEDDVNTTDEIVLPNGAKTTYGLAVGVTSYWAQYDGPRMIQNGLDTNVKLDALAGKLDTLIGLLTPKA